MMARLIAQIFLSCDAADNRTGDRHSFHVMPLITARVTDIPFM